MTYPPRGAGSTDTADLMDAVRRLSRTSVLVVGDAMLDRFVYGSVTRVSPEAPIAILSVERDVVMPGGAGNVVRNLTALGAAVAFVSVVGDDQAGSDLTGLIGGQPNVEPWLLVQGSRTTTTKTRYLAQGQQLLRADHEIVAPIHPKLVERLLRITQDALTATTVTVLSDYNKGVLAGELPSRIIAAAKTANRRVVVGPAGRDYGRYAGADIIVTPTRSALAEASGMVVDTPEAIVAAAQSLVLAHGFGAMLVVRAADGMTLVMADGSAHHFPAEAVEVFDVSGAGDTVVATVAAGLAAGLALPMVARLANIAAGIVVGKIGTAVARETDLLAALSPQGSALRKVVTREQAAEQVERWRQRGWATGFTDGPFDTMQASHVHLLEHARSHCDRLVVGLNSDVGLRRLKGGERPAQSEAARAAVLGSLTSVDLVCLFDEETPLETLQALRPEVLVKPAEQVSGPVAGGEFVQSYGGKVVLTDPLPDHPAPTVVPRLRTV